MGEALREDDFDGRELRIMGLWELTTVSDMGHRVRRSPASNVYLEGCWRLIDDLRSLLEGPGGSLFTLSGDHFGSGLSRCLGLGGHGSLELHREPHILAAGGKATVRSTLTRHTTLSVINTTYCVKIRVVRI